MYRIREGKKEDFSEIAAIYSDPAHSHLLIEQQGLLQSDYEKYIGCANNKIYVVQKSGEIVGFIFFHLNEEQDTVLIDGFSIWKEYVKKGIDEHLYHKMCRFAARRNMMRLETKLTTNDPVVRTFFTEKGWQPGEGENIFIRHL